MSNQNFPVIGQKHGRTNSDLGEESNPHHQYDASRQPARSILKKRHTRYVYIELFTLSRASSCPVVLYCPNFALLTYNSTPFPVFSHQLRLSFGETVPVSHSRTGSGRAGDDVEAHASTTASNIGNNKSSRDGGNEAVETTIGWDENNLMQNEFERVPRMKVTEPKTPYHHEDPDPMSVSEHELDEGDMVEDIGLQLSRRIHEEQQQRQQQQQLVQGVRQISMAGSESPLSSSSTGSRSSRRSSLSQGGHHPLHANAHVRIAGGPHPHVHSASESEDHHRHRSSSSRSKNKKGEGERESPGASGNQETANGGNAVEDDNDDSGYDDDDDDDECLYLTPEARAAAEAARAKFDAARKSHYNMRAALMKQHFSDDESEYEEEEEGEEGQEEQSVQDASGGKAQGSSKRMAARASGMAGTDDDAAADGDDDNDDEDD